MPMLGPLEVDETYFGGKRKNMHARKRKQLSGRGSVGKTAVVGAKDRTTKQVRARVVPATDGPTLQGFIAENAAPDAQVFTDDATRLSWDGESDTRDGEAFGRCSM